MRAGWRVTKVYSYFTFEQERFKRDFILLNQKSCQNTKNSIEKDFFKQLHNPNFAYDCRNNLDNCIFEPIRDKINEIFYPRKIIIIYSIKAFQSLIMLIYLKKK